MKYTFDENFNRVGWHFEAFVKITVNTKFKPFVEELEKNKSLAAIFVAFISAESSHARHQADIL